MSVLSPLYQLHIHLFCEDSLSLSLMAPPNWLLCRFLVFVHLNEWPFKSLQLFKFGSPGPQICYFALKIACQPQMQLFRRASLLTIIDAIVVKLLTKLLDLFEKTSVMSCHVI